MGYHNKDYDEFIELYKQDDHSNHEHEAVDIQKFEATTISTLSVNLEAFGK